MGMHLCDKTRLLTSPGSEPQGASFFFLLLCVCVRVSLSVFDILAFVHKSSAFFFVVVFFFFFCGFNKATHYPPAPATTEVTFIEVPAKRFFDLNLMPLRWIPAKDLQTACVRSFFSFFFFGKPDLKYPHPAD